MKKELKRRSAIEPVIGHMKTDGKLGRNHLLGALGDKIHALLCGAGHNIRLILRKLRELLLFLCTECLQVFLEAAIGFYDSLTALLASKQIMAWRKPQAKNSFFKGD